MIETFYDAKPFEMRTLILHIFIDPKASGRYFRPVDI